MRRAAVVAVVALAVPVLGCGGKRGATPPVAPEPRAATAAERLIALLPEGAQLVVELDLARLRANPVVGALVARMLDGELAGAEDLPPGAEVAVFGAYGLGTAQAATLLLVRSPRAVPNASRVANGIYALGPAEWVEQARARGELADRLTVPAELARLRDRAMPPAAPGASLRVTARLSFDARIALARITGLEAAPSQLSVWGDVVDDLAIIVDADATDPGEKSARRAVARLETIIRAALAMLGDDPRVRSLGLTSSLRGAKLVTRGTWVRTIIAVGPRHLQRVVERALAALATEEASS